MSDWSRPPAPTLPPPAWYPDPSGVGELRYWDGSRWTSGVVIGGQVTERALPWPPAAGAHGAPGTLGAAGPPGEPDERIVLPGRAALYALAGFVAGIAAGLLLALAGDAAGLPDVAVLVLNLIGLWSGLVGACWWASRRYGSGNILRDFGLRVRAKDFSWGLLMSLGARVAGIIVLIPFILFASDEYLGSNQGVYGEIRDSLPGFLVFAVIAVVGAPLAEELFFRGLLQRSLSTVIGTAGAIVVQAVLFGLSHVSPLLGKANFSIVALITAAGVVFGLTAWWRRVGTSVAAHGFFNLMSVIAAALV